MPFSNGATTCRLRSLLKWENGRLRLKRLMMRFSSNGLSVVMIASGGAGVFLLEMFFMKGLHKKAHCNHLGSWTGSMRSLVNEQNRHDSSPFLVIPISWACPFDGGIG